MVSTASGTTLIIDQAGSATFGNQIAGDGALVKQGSGTLTLNGANGFTGGTTVIAGQLRVDGTTTSDTHVTAGARWPEPAASGATSRSLMAAHCSPDGAGADNGQPDPLGKFDCRCHHRGTDAKRTVRCRRRTDPRRNTGHSDSLGFAPGITRLFDYGGALTDNGLDIGGVPVGADAADFAVQTAVAGQVNLINTGGLTLSHWDGGAAGSASNGQVDGGSGVWSLTSENWTDATALSPMRCSPSRFAVFAGPAGTVTVDNGAGMVVTRECSLPRRLPDRRRCADGQ